MSQQNEALGQGIQLIEQPDSYVLTKADGTQRTIAKTDMNRQHIEQNYADILVPMESQMEPDPMATDQQVADPNTELGAQDFSQPGSQEQSGFQQVSAPNITGQNGRRLGMKGVDPFNQKGVQKQIGAIRKQGELAQAESDLIASENQRHILEAEGIENERRAKTERIRSEMDNLQTEYDNAVSDLGANVVDPKRYWKNKDAGDKILASIGIMLGALGGTLSGSNDNIALDLINREIDRDINAQMNEYQKKKDSVSALNTKWGQIQQRLGSEEAAYAAMKEGAIANTIGQINKIKSSLKGEQQVAKADMLIGQLQSQQAQAQDEAYQKLAQQVYDQRKERIKGEDELADRLEKQQWYKDWQGLKANEMAIQNTSASAQGDMALIFMFMKTLDPGSVVREGEFQNVRSTAPIVDELQQKFRALYQGRIALDKGTRARLKREAKMFIKNKTAPLMSNVKRFEKARKRSWSRPKISYHSP